jgi:hypothetical protein
MEASGTWVKVNNVPAGRITHLSTIGKSQALLMFVAGALTREFQEPKACGNLR